MKKPYGLKKSAIWIIMEKTHRCRVEGGVVPATHGSRHTRYVRMSLEKQEITWYSSFSVLLLFALFYPCAGAACCICVSGLRIISISPEARTPAHSWMTQPRSPCTCRRSWCHWPGSRAPGRSSVPRLNGSEKALRHVLNIDSACYTTALIKG